MTMVHLFWLGVILVFISGSIGQTKNLTLPLVLWHGVGDNCCGWVKHRVGGLAEKHIPGIYVKSLMLGDTPEEDLEHGYFMNVNKKVQLACDLIRNDPELKDGYNAIGFSQGSQFFRAVIQRCPDPPINNFITLGGQHQGVYGLPNCPGITDARCDGIRRLLHNAAYWEPVQERVVQAQYWHDPINENDYRNRNIFLADINQELITNETYKRNLMKLQNFVMVRFSEEEVVDPPESQWFGFYKSGQGYAIESLRESKLYKEDRLGLAKMDAEGKLKFLTTEGKHMHFTDEWFVQDIIMPYL